MVKLLILIFASLLLLGLAIVCMPTPISQWESYHNFADTRQLLAVPHFWNVASNLLFCIVGIWGLYKTYVAPKSWQPKSWQPKSWQEKALFSSLYVAVFLTGLGSGYYHLNPNNETLCWDRIPITMVIASLVSLIVFYRIDQKIGLFLLLPLIFCGVWSVLYWIWTESQGRGDLRPYALMQYFSLVVITLIVLIFPKPYPPTKYLTYALLFYVLAKVFETFDHQIYDLTGHISGHTLKHIAAAIAAFFLLF